MTPWNHTGTATQIAITREAILNYIKFPWARMSLPGQPELGWRDLNGNDDWWKSVVPKGARAHGDNLHDGDRPHGLEIEVNGRRQIGGVFFPGSARIFIDVSLEREPEVAMHVTGFEAFHAIDEFFMNDAQRNELMRRWNKGGTWWEASDYSREYFTLGGEAFMYEGLGAYSDFKLGPNPFLHDAGVEPEDVREILGVERTDFVEAPKAVVYGKSKIFHLSSHYPAKKNPKVITIGAAAGYRGCKVCKP